jgi:hypothetical protein
MYPVDNPLEIYTWDSHNAINMSLSHGPTRKRNELQICPSKRYSGKQQAQLVVFFLLLSWNAFTHPGSGSWHDDDDVDVVDVVVPPRQR